MRKTMPHTRPNGDRLVAAFDFVAYVVPGPHRAAEIPRQCRCVWWQAEGSASQELRRVSKACHVHGFVDAPVGALCTVLALAGRANVPDPMVAPIKRLRASLRTHADRPKICTARADVRALLVWLAEAHVPRQVLIAFEDLDPLIDWAAYPYSNAEAYALRGD